MYEYITVSCVLCSKKLALTRQYTKDHKREEKGKRLRKKTYKIKPNSVEKSAPEVQKKSFEIITANKMGKLCRKHISKDT